MGININLKPKVKLQLVYLLDVEPNPVLSCLVDE